MSYFPDLSPYQYFARHEPEGVSALNVGWLSREHPYVTGDTALEFRKRLFLFSQDRHVVHLARGFHVCEFCTASSSSQWFEQGRVRYGEAAHWLGIGCGEIRIFGAEVVFAAPSLVYHYIAEHGYRPPPAFIEAVVNAAAPDSAEHRRLLARWQLNGKANAKTGPASSKSSAKRADGRCAH